MALVGSRCSGRVNPPQEYYKESHQYKVSSFLKNVIPDRLGSRLLCLSFANLSVVEFTFFPPVLLSSLLIEIIKIMVYHRLKGNLISRFDYDH